jgi:hypothetical protein
MEIKTNMMMDLIGDIKSSLDNQINEQIKKALGKHGFDCDVENNFNLLSRVKMATNYGSQNRRQELILDGVVILCISEPKIEIKDNKVSSYIEYYEPRSTNNVTKQ